MKIDDKVFVELCGEGSYAEIEEALKDGASVNALVKLYELDAGETPLINAARDNPDPNVITLLCSYGASVNKINQFGETALMEAVRRGNLDVVKALLIAGANVNFKDRDNDTALTEAVYKGDIQIMRALLEADAYADERNGALRLAAGKGRLEIVKLLLDFEADVNSKNYNGYNY